MTPDELKLKLSILYLLYGEIESMDSRRRYLETGMLVEQSDDETMFAQSEIEKETYYRYLKELINKVRDFLKENIEAQYTQETLKYINEQEMESAYGVSYAPSIMENNLEVARIQYRGAEFLDYAEMVILNPLLHIIHFLYKAATGTSYSSEHEAVFEN